MFDVDFDRSFQELTGHTPLRWQQRLFQFWFADGRIPNALDLATGLGKTSVMAIWYIAFKAGASLPRRLVYVVDRRAVVDQATTEADAIRKTSSDASLRVSTLRGQHADNQEWLADPATPAIIVGTVDMIGSRLLFEGYGVSRRMRPYHAGLLGADTLVVLDESHLVPPFERLLEQISAHRDLAARSEADRLLIPNFHFLSLSATGREREGEVFRLIDEDRQDPIARQRLTAEKRLKITPNIEKTRLEERLAEKAWDLASNGTSYVRVLVFCNSRDVAERSKLAIEKRAGKTDIQTELFVGARRVRERADAAWRLGDLGFLAGRVVTIERPTFLFATSAAEVGVDLDADDMVMDLVPFERMVQRLGRVNRLGTKNASVIVVEAPDPRLPGELRKSAGKCGSLLRCLPGDEEKGFDASPRALEHLRAERSAQVEAASTREPLSPALTRPLVDAWSMTSLDEHLGRPNIGPWLRGWEQDDRPETRIAWRLWLPVRASANTGEGVDVSTTDIEEFFAAAPPHLTEILETETTRVVDWLFARAATLAKHLRPRDAQDPSPGDPNTDIADETEGAPLPLTHRSPVAFALTPRHGLKMNRDNEPSVYRLGGLCPKPGEKSRLAETLRFELAGATLVVDARLAGLSKDGLLNADEDEVPITADGYQHGGWMRDGDQETSLGFRVRPPYRTDKRADESFGRSFRFAVKSTLEGDPYLELPIETTTTENSRSTARRAQSLAEHQAWVESKATAIAEGLGLTGEWAKVLPIAARLHDEGKRAKCWQRAFSAPLDGEPLAKTRGPFRAALLRRYRHEFGSLAYVKNSDEFGHLSEGPQDLVLHLIAAHHGRARPVIDYEDCEDGPPEAMAERARDVALRFARLQRRWGPWGLAWWESLLRAADGAASRELDGYHAEGNPRGDGG